MLEHGPLFLNCVRWWSAQDCCGMSSGVKGSWACVVYCMTCVPHLHTVVVGGRLWSLMFIQPCSETRPPSFPLSLPFLPSAPFSLSVPLSSPYCVYLAVGTGGATVAWVKEKTPFGSGFFAPIGDTSLYTLARGACLHPETSCCCLFSPQSTQEACLRRGSHGDWRVTVSLQASVYTLPLTLLLCAHLSSSLINYLLNFALSVYLRQSHAAPSDL